MVCALFSHLIREQMNGHIHVLGLLTMLTMFYTQKSPAWCTPILSTTLLIFNENCYIQVWGDPSSVAREGVVYFLRKLCQ